MKLSKLIALHVRRLLKERGWKPYRLAIRSGIPHSTLCNLLKANGKSLTLETLLNICRGLDIPIKDFFDDEMFNFENISDD